MKSSSYWQFQSTSWSTGASIRNCTKERWVCEAKFGNNPAANLYF